MVCTPGNEKKKDAFFLFTESAPFSTYTYIRYTIAYTLDNKLVDYFKF